MEQFAKNEYGDYILLDFAKENTDIKNNFIENIGDTATYNPIRFAFDTRKPLGDAIHRKIMKIFRTYMVAGGMPQAVNAYVHGKTFAQIDFIKRNILNLYEEDLA